MRVLRLTNSDDINPRIPEGQHSWEVCERELSQQTGVPAETLVKIIWPDDALPDRIDRWIRREEPELVMLNSSSFWFTYESVPLKVQRHVPVVGKHLASVGIKAAEVPWLSENAIFRGVRKLTLRTIGGEAYFTPEYIADLMERCIRAALKHEGVGLAVRGPLGAFGGDGGATAFARSKARRACVDQRMGDVCRQLRVAYLNRESFGLPEETTEALLGDRVHATAETHRERGIVEGRALSGVWRELHS